MQVEEKEPGVLFDNEHMIEVLMPKNNHEEDILNKYFSAKDPLEVIKELKDSSDKDVILYLDEKELDNEMERTTIVVDLQGDILMIPKSIDEIFNIIDKYNKE